MPFVPITPPEGLYLNNTDYGSQGRWRRANLVRFFRGTPQPVGGWTKLPITYVDDSGVTRDLDRLPGLCRGIASWRDNDEIRWMAFGTTTHLWVSDGSKFYDITPAGLLPGDENANYGSGYGAFFYSEDHSDYPDAHTGGAFAYSTERPAAITSLVQEPGAWTFSTWGEDLIACPNWDGKLYAWTPGDAAAVEISNGLGVVPQVNRACLVSNERHLIAIGSGDWNGAVWNKNQRKVAWSTSEDREDWVPSVTNSAGDLQLRTKGVAITGAAFKSEILIWTDVDVHRMFYTGAPYYYGIKRVSPTGGLFSVNSHVETSEFVFWVGPDGFFIYDGTVRTLSPDISDDYRDSLDKTQVAKIACGHNPAFKEIWTFYPSKDGADNENDSYIIWNYESNTWSIGSLKRSCWDEASIWDHPIATETIVEASVVGATRNMLIYKENTNPVYSHQLWIPFVTPGYNPSARIPLGGWPTAYAQVENVVVTGPGGTPVYDELGVGFPAAYAIDYERGMIKTFTSYFGSGTADLEITYDVVGANYTVPYNHEDGYTDNGFSRDVWITLSPFEIANGDNLAVVRRIVQDTGREDDLDPALNSNAIEIEFESRLAPEAGATTEGPYTLDTVRGYTDVRFTGRQVGMTVRQVKDELWRLGRLRLEVKPGSGR